MAGGFFSQSSIATRGKKARSNKTRGTTDRGLSTTESAEDATPLKSSTTAESTNRPSGELNVAIIADDREPGDILENLPSDATICRLEFADYVFVSRNLSVGVERKTVPDLLGSLANGRLDRQIAGLCRDYDVPVLLIQGEFTVGRTGKIRIRGKESGWHYDAVMNRLQTFQEYGVRLAFSPDSTAWLIKRLKSLRSFYARDDHQLKPRIEMSVTKSDYTASELALSQVPGIGLDRSRKLHLYFGSMFAIVTASEEQLRYVPGIGPKIAKEIWSTFRSG